jgi:hypothetical protein
VDTNTCDPLYDCAGLAEPPNEDVAFPTATDPLYPLITYKLPEKSLSLDASFLDADVTLRYSVANPVFDTFLAESISPTAKPVTLTTYIVASAAV